MITLRLDALSNIFFGGMLRAKGRYSMTVDIVRAALGWCSIINMALLLWWFFALIVLHDWVYKWHSKWFKLSVEKFDQIHYTGIAFFKILLLFFNIVPYFSLLIAGR